MAEVVCNKECKYRKAVYCGFDFTMLNQFGQCVIWFNRDGSQRYQPDYRRNISKDKKQEAKQIEERSVGETTKTEGLIT